MARLNGWRRLWIVWCVLALPIAIVTVGWLTQGKTEYDRLDKEKWQAKRDARAAYDARNPYSVYFFSNEQIPDQQVQNDFKIIDRRYAVLYAEARPKVLTFLWTLVGVLWAVMVGSVYGIGATFGWVRDGFRGASTDRAEIENNQ